MPELDEILGTKIAEYESVEEFTAALEAAKPVRLHTYFDKGMFWFGSNWKASFVDSEGNVHGFVTRDVEEGFQDRIKPIYDLLKGAKIPEVDGIIRVSERDGAVYQVFETDFPDEAGKEQASYDAWIDAVKALPVEGTLIQYLKEDSSVLLDATNGKNHFITTIDEDSGITLESTLAKLQPSKNKDGAEVLGQPFATRDNSPVIGWYLDMENE